MQNTRFVIVSVSIMFQNNTCCVCNTRLAVIDGLGSCWVFSFFFLLKYTSVVCQDSENDKIACINLNMSLTGYLDMLQLHTWPLQL